MQACECPHDAGLHAPSQDTGLSFCLAPSCDCEGTREQVAAMVAARVFRSSDAKLERLVALIKEVLGNQMHRTPDEKARNVAAAIVGNYEIEER